MQKVAKALKDKVDYECEIRIKNPDGAYRWYRTIGQCERGG